MMHGQPRLSYYKIILKQLEPIGTVSQHSLVFSRQNYKGG